MEHGAERNADLPFIGTRASHHAKHFATYETHIGINHWEQSQLDHVAL